MKVINEDCMYGLDQMAENSIDLLITDPPYSTPVITAFGRKKFKNLADLSIQEFYFTEMKKKLERTLKPDAPVFFFCDDKFYPILFSAFYDWQNIGLIIWDKNKIGMGKQTQSRNPLRSHPICIPFSSNITEFFFSFFLIAFMFFHI